MMMTMRSFLNERVGFSCVSSVFGWVQHAVNRVSCLFSENAICCDVCDNKNFATATFFCYQISFTCLSPKQSVKVY